MHAICSPLPPRRSARLLIKAGLALATLLSALSFSPAVTAQTNVIEVTDVAGRAVKVKKGVERAILGEGRLMYALSALDKEAPFRRVIGWKDDLIKFDPDAYRKFKAIFPKDTDRLINFGNPFAGDFSIEKVVASKADLVILELGTLQKAEETGVMAKLDKVGVPVIFVDFRFNATENTIPSLLLLGRVFDREAKAAEFLDFYMREMRRVTNVVQGIPVKSRPLVFLENAPGYDGDFCCNTFGSYNFGRFVELAGGRNWGSTKFSGYSSNVNLEAVIADKPDLIIGTGANWAEESPSVKSVLLGYEAKEAGVDERLKALSERLGFKDLSAVKNKRFHSIYHQFYNSPFHFVAIQQIAKWVHPKEFADLDPKVTFEELHARFLPFGVSGQFWASLK